jgi:flagellar assembly protein FliH
MTMLPASGAAAPAAVLRNVAVNPQPHTLARPGRPDAAAAPAVPAAPPPSAADIAAELEQAYGRGLAQGLADGRREALAAACGEQLAQAREEGLREGRDAGLRAGQAEALAAVQGALDALQRLLAELPERFQARLAASEDDMVALSFEAVARILGEQAAAADGVRGMLRAAVAQFGARRLAEIHLHPDDVQCLTSSDIVAEWLRRREGGEHVRIVGDPAVELGGVVLRSPAGRLDARLELQVEALRDALLSVRAGRAMAQAAAGQQPARGVPRAPGGVQ